MGWDFAPPQHALPAIEAGIEEMKIALPGRSRSIPRVTRIGSSGRDTGFTAPQSGGRPRIFRIAAIGLDYAASC